MNPIAFFDIEATGLDIASDRIVEFGAVRYDRWPSDWLDVRRLHFRCNPQREMTEEVIAIHGITNEEVRDLPPFESRAREVADFISGCDVGGFNLLNFDVPLLVEEFLRCGFEWEWQKVHFIDAGNIFKKREERTLSAAVKFYLDREHADAHSASSDAEATAEILCAQLIRYPDLPKGRADLAAFSRMEDRIDPSGRIVRNKDGVPVYNFGKVKGTPVLHDRGFAHWMLSRDFPRATRKVLEQILDGEIQ